MAGDISIEARTVALLMNGGRLTLGWKSETGPAEQSDTSIGRRRTTDRAYSQLRVLVSTVSFWTAIGLPTLYLPLLLRGLESVAGLGLFLGLFGLHVLALIGGRHHRP